MTRATIPALAALAFALAAGCRAKPSDGDALRVGDHRFRVLAGIWEMADGGLVGRAGVVETEERFRDGVIDVDVELLSGPPAYDLGVAFRYAATGGDIAKGNGYGFNFTFSKAVRIVRGVEGQYVTLAPSPAVVPGLSDRLNHLRITMKGPSFEVSVNHHPPVRFQDATFPAGHVSFWVDSLSQRVRFSNFRFTKI